MCKTSLSFSPKLMVFASNPCRRFLQRSTDGNAQIESDDQMLIRILKFKAVNASSIPRHFEGIEHDACACDWWLGVSGR